MTNQRMLFPEPAAREVVRGLANPSVKEPTFAMNPQQGAGRLPFLIHILAKDPPCGSLMLSAARGVVICRGVRRGQPSLEVLEDPLPYRYL